MIKLGMIGLSEGNGHPYSWSAIFNNYNQDVMKTCPFPVIPHYLAKQNFPDAAIQDARVTHIWTQDIHLSQHIADATYIPHIVEHMEQLIPEVDAVLLARDDAHNHIEMAKPFLQAGLPIYIDKPIALTCAEVKILFSMQKYSGQIFTCSAFQYARELIHVDHITHIEAFIKNDWDKYAIHLIEPIIKIIGYEHTVKCTEVIHTEHEKSAHYQFSNQSTVKIHTYKNRDVKPTIRFFSHEKMVQEIIFVDTFFAFKSALQHFIDGIKEKKEMTKKDFVLRCIEMIEQANKFTAIPSPLVAV